MMSSPIVPCLWLDDQAEEAARFYTGLFPGGRVAAVSRYPDSFDNPGGKPRGSVSEVEFEVAGQRFTALNGGPQFVINPSISFFVHTESAGETDRLFAALAADGQVMMPLDSYPWSQRYGWVQDRFGVSWQVITEAPARPDAMPGATIVPCLMFTGAQHGRAEEAMKHYVGVFSDGPADSQLGPIDRYSGEDGPAGTVKYGRFALAGQDMIAMDSHGDHGFGFSEGLSLQVRCETQEELDRCWATLSEGGQPVECGWLKDRFGLSWQVLPAALGEWLSSEDSAARDRAFAAMFEMQKLDMAALEAAFAGA
ncbi:MAG: VOC family protein [Haliangiales bacterium]